MLIKFAVKNYRGFSERIEWDLSSPSNYEFNNFAIKDGIIKNGIIYGPNGSGKTNFGLAIFDIAYHLAPLKAKKADYYYNFVFSGDFPLTVDFEYVFKFGQKITKYKYSKDYKGNLISETLDLEGSTLVNFNKENEGTLLINLDYFPLATHILDKLKENDNNISIINFLLLFYPLSDDNILMQIQKFVNNMLWFRGLDTREFIGIETQSNINVDEFIIKNDLLIEFSQFLERVSDQKFEFATLGPNDKYLWYAVSKNQIPFQLTVSTGTHALALLYYWIKHIKNASFVFIDEFDAFYHFKLAYNVCKELFKLNCQLFLSSHNTYLMSNDLLRPDCNFILTNNRIKPLCESTEKELRFGHNIEKIYRAGAFYVE